MISVHGFIWQGSTETQNVGNDSIFDNAHSNLGKSVSVSWAHVQSNFAYKEWILKLTVYWGRFVEIRVCGERVHWEFGWEGLFRPTSLQQSLTTYQCVYQSAAIA